MPKPIPPSPSSTADQPTLPLSALPQDGDAPVTLGTLGPVTVGTVGLGASASKTPRVVPQEFAGYRRVRQLGIGGMGEVHLAHHQRLNRHVALKLLRPNVSDDQDFNARFLREAKAMAAVNHVNVVAIHDAGEVDGFLFMAIEYVEGTDVGKLLKTRGVLDEATALTIMIGCCRGLEAIHAAGLVHRDIKPANIFLDRQGEPKIGDLGLARHADGDDRMTMTGSAWGTPAYMPPEQLRGVADIDIRCDLYALGATLFTLLTGSEPFTGQTAFVITTRILTEAAPDPRTLNRTVSPALAAIIRACLEKDRDKRYPTPTALRIDLERARDHLPLAFASLASIANTPPGEAAPPIIGATARRPPSPAAAAAGSLQVNATLAKFLVYGTAAGLLALVIWSLRGGTTAMVQKLPILVPETDTTALLKPSQPWMQVEDRDGIGAWARLVVNKVPVRLRHLPAGTFRMGSPLTESGRSASETPHQVTLSTSFWICETEVTRDLWAEVMGNGIPGTEPVINVSWHDARDFLNALGARVPGLNAQLPTEAQWEYACRAGSGEAFPGGPHADPSEAVAVKALRSVASGKPNRFGLFDLPGNVREWCLDNWDGLEALPELADSDPLSRFGTLSVVRGGAWDAGEDAARSAARIAIDPQQRLIDVGFRFVVEDPPDVQP
jgi:Protein kinase domain/Sulfatase-modifying factor enzyme 1